MYLLEAKNSPVSKIQGVTTPRFPKYQRVTTSRFPKSLYLSCDTEEFFGNKFFFSDLILKLLLIVDNYVTYNL